MQEFFVSGSIVSKSSSSIILDSFDLAILSILQRDNTTPQRVIGEAVNLSAPAVQRRIRPMEEVGVIQANVAVIDPIQVGQAITILTLNLSACPTTYVGKTPIKK